MSRLKRMQKPLPRCHRLSVSAEPERFCWRLRAVRLNAYQLLQPEQQLHSAAWHTLITQWQSTHRGNLPFSWFWRASERDNEVRLTCVGITHYFTYRLVISAPEISTKRRTEVCKRKSTAGKCRVLLNVVPDLIYSFQKKNINLNRKHKESQE